MSAYESARLDDYCQRRAAERDPLTEREQRDFDRLAAMAQTELDNEPRPHWYGGDYPDL